MANLAEIEGRIAAALERLARALEERDMTARPGDREAEGGRGGAVPDEMPDEMRASLEAGFEARLQAEIQAAATREAGLRRDCDERLARLNRQLDAQGQELHRMRQAANALRNELHRLREARLAEIDGPALIDGAMRAELAALEAGRKAEAAELDEIMAALAVHLSDVEGAGAEHA